jgi:hypothetical protein
MYRKLKKQAESRKPNKKLLACPVLPKYYTDIKAYEKPLVLRNVGWNTLTQGFNMLRVCLVDQKTCLDFYSQEESIYEVPEEVREHLMRSLPNNVNRHIMSFLSPCASKSCNIWTNKCTRWDADCNSPAGHIHENEVVLPRLHEEIRFLTNTSEAMQKLIHVIPFYQYRERLDYLT